MLDSSFTDLELTPPVRDGGRDVIGFYRVGKTPCLTRLTVYAEAKKWSGSVGVKPVARLISRIKHRDIGVFITTSWYDKQIQQELIDDKHPVILVSGKEIISILKENDINTVEKIEKWLQNVLNQE
jgi:restriction endonuclease Mrr